MASNEFTKQLSEPDLGSIATPQLQTNTGSDASDILSAVNFGLQTFQAFEKREQLQQQALVNQEKEQSVQLGVNFANNLTADLATIDKSKRLFARGRREAQFLQENKNNPLAVEAYFSTLKGRGEKSSVQIQQDLAVAKQKQIEEERTTLVLEGKQLLRGMSASPQYQTMLDNGGIDNVPEQELIALARQHSGRKQILASKVAEQSYAISTYDFNQTQASDQEKAIKAKVNGEAQVKLLDITTKFKVPHSILSNSSTPEQKIEASQSLAVMLDEGRQELDNYVSSLTDEERSRLDVQTLYSQFEGRVNSFKGLTDPDKVTKYSDANIKQAFQAYMVDQFTSGSRNGQTVALSALMGLPQQPDALLGFQSEIANGKTSFGALSQTLVDVYDGKSSSAGIALPLFNYSGGKPVAMEDTEVGDLAAPFLIAAMNPRNEVHNPKAQGGLDNLVTWATESPEGLDSLVEGLEERGVDPVEAFFKSNKNYVNGTLAPSLATLRNEGMSGVQITLDGNSNIIITPEASKAEQFGRQAPRPSIGSGSVAPAMPLQLNVKAGRIARQVATDLNKRLDTLQKILPDVDRATIAQMLLDGTGLAFQSPQVEGKE